MPLGYEVETAGLSTINAQDLANRNKNKEETIPYGFAYLQFRYLIMLFLFGAY